MNGNTGTGHGPSPSYEDAVVALLEGRISEAEHLARTARARTADTALYARLAAPLADALVAQRRHAEALELLAEALDTPQMPTAWRADLLLTAGRCQIRVGRKVRDQRNISNAVALTRAAAEARRAAMEVPAEELAALAEALLLAGSPKEALETILLLGRAFRGLSRLSAAWVALAISRVRMAQHRFGSACWWARLAVSKRSTRLHETAPLALEAELQCAIATWRAGANEEAATILAGIVRREPAMLFAALDEPRGPDAWVRMRLGNDAAEMLASLLWAQGNEPSAREQLARLLLDRWGHARAARRAQLRGDTLTPHRAQLSEGDCLLALLPLHPLSPLDHDSPWDVNVKPSRLLMVVEFPGIPARIQDIGARELVLADATRWRGQLRRDIRAVPPAAIQAVVNAAANAERVLMIADGVLEALPWSAVLDPLRGIHLLATTHESRSNGNGTARLLIAVSPDFPADATHVRSEVAAAAADASHCDILVGEQASAPAILKAVHSATRAHLIAHGQGGIDTPASALNPYALSALAVSDGMLTADEVAAARVQGLELAVLAGCSTARGVRQFGEGEASMAAAFLDGGATSVIASIWDVPDTETAEFMSMFYAQDIAEPAAALAGAQRRARSRGLRPAAWAGWCCYSDGIPQNGIALKGNGRLF